MLSSAESDLVRRESALPGLAVVLEPEAFAAALRRAAPQAELRSARVLYIRFKPHHYCRVTYRLEVAGAELEVDVRAGRREDFATWLVDEEEEIVSGPLGPGRIVLEDEAVVIHVFPNDLKLPGLKPLADPLEKERVFKELFPDSPGLWRGELRCLRYRPERRYVSALRAAGEDRAILKSYTRKAYLRARHNAEVFHSRGPLRVARVLGRSDGHRLLAFEWLPGRLLKELCVAPPMHCTEVSAAGAAVAELHAQAVAGLNAWTGAAAAAELLVLASEVGFIHPKVGRRCDELARRLAGQLAGAPQTQRAVHGDFSANQVLVDRQAYTAHVVLELETGPRYRFGPVLFEDGALRDRKQEPHSWVRDPVCGMRVDEWTAEVTAGHDGMRYVFCSFRCLERFRATPERYLAAHPGPAIAVVTREEAVR